MRFDPRKVALLPARSSRAVIVSLAASRPLRPGVYRGTIQAKGRPASGCRSRSRSTRADRRRRSPRGGVFGGRQPARAPLDARRHPRRRAAPLALPRRPRVPEPAGQSDPARRCAWRRAARSAGATATSCRSPLRSSCCTTPSSSTTTSSTAAERRRGRPTLTAEYGLGLALNAGDALAVRLQPGPAAPRRLHGRRPRRPPPVRVRCHGTAHARGPGHRARLAPRPRGGAGARGLPRPDHAQDVLVHDRASPAGRGAGRLPRRCRPATDGAVRLLSGRGVPDPGRSAEPRRHRARVRQGDRRRSLRGQAHACR